MSLFFLLQDSEHNHEVRIPVAAMTGTGEQLFDFMARETLSFISSHQSKERDANSNRRVLLSVCGVDLSSI